jgi:putative transposase
MRRRHRRFDYANTFHFVTTVTRERGKWFVTDDVCTQILSTFERFRMKYGLVCIGYVLMPDHFHALVLQVEDGPVVSNVMACFKRETSKSLGISGRFQKTLWRDYYDDVPIPGSDALWKRLSYIHENPVRRGLVSDVAEYRWSSLRFYYEMDKGTLIQIARP